MAAVEAAEAILEGLYEEWRRTLGAERYAALHQLLAELAAVMPSGRESPETPAGHDIDDRC